MEVFRDIEKVPELSRPVVAIGSFDGVHLGHRQILHYLCEEASRRGGQSVVVTFDPHPQQVMRPHTDFFTINTLEQNLSLIGSQGVDVAVVIPFTESFSHLSYVDFIEQCIIGRVHAHALVMGPNHAIGHNREGGRPEIETLCLLHGVQVIDIPEFVNNETEVHSSTIRNLIRNGELDKAEALLGYHYPLGNIPDETFQNKIYNPKTEKL